MELGLGAGWFAAEHAAYALPFPSPGRFGMLEEQLAIVTGLWQTPVGERFDYTGSHYTVVNSPGLPKPVQQPRPPIVMGGSGRQRSARSRGVRRRVQRGLRHPEQISAAFGASQPPAPTLVGRRLDALVGGQTVLAGRGGVRRPTRSAVTQPSCGFGLGGTPNELVERIGEFADLGASTVYLQLLDLDDLDQLALLADTVLPQIE